MGTKQKTDTPLRNRNILIGVTGSIAAYKSADLVRRFQEAGAKVTCMLTPGAQKFITPLTLGALSGQPAFGDVFDPALWRMSHLALAQKADAVVVGCYSEGAFQATARQIDEATGGVLTELVEEQE